jgi:hypothetical protein
MRTQFIVSCLLTLSVSAITRGQSAEPIPAPIPAAPATRSVAAVDARDVALNYYFYVDFPRQLKALQYEKERAEAELDLIARRVESYRPFRSFGRYAATYTADLSWRVELLAAQHRLECLRDKEADLWRERRAVAAATALGMHAPAR